MSGRSQVTRGASLLLLTGIMLAGGGWFASLRWRPVAPPPDAEFTALAAEAEALRGNTDTERDTWRKRREGVAQHAWTPGALEAIASETAEAWHWEWIARDRARLRCAHPQVEEWPAYVAFLESLHRKPGVTVEAIGVSATGAGRERRFSEVTIGLGFILDDATRGDGVRAGPSPGPPPVAPADVPDPTRKIGPVLRSAQPPLPPVPTLRVPGPEFNP